MQRKQKKRAAAKRKVAEEAQRATSETRAAKVPRTDENDEGERGVVEKVDPSQKSWSSLFKSVDKAELVRRAVAHAAAAAVHFPMDEDDDDDDDDDEADNAQDQPDIARDLKGELSVVAEQLANLEEAPSATVNCVRSSLLQQPIPVIEFNKLVSPKAIGTNTTDDSQDQPARLILSIVGC